MSTSITTLNEIGVAELLSMAGSEGWNPGLDDAGAFYQSDPEGFLALSLNGEFAAGISVVRYDTDYSFLGLYLCKPAHRGKGLGWQIWQTGLDRINDTVVGLDGVVEQQSNYQRSGFAFAYRNIRYCGDFDLPKHPVGDHAAGIRPATRSDISSIVTLDTQTTGMKRSAYLSAWSADAAHRRTFVCESDGLIAGVVTIRRCLEGFKIGPLFAEDERMAEQLLISAASSMNAIKLTIDVPEPNQRAMGLVEKLGFTAVFETARMFNGPAPVAQLDKQFGVCTLELG